MPASRASCGLRIYPGRAVKFVRTDTQIFTFLKSKCRTLFNQRKKPAKLAWTSLYRKQHKKDQEYEDNRARRLELRGGFDADDDTTEAFEEETVEFLVKEESTVMQE